jgi:hypothetical protein
MVRNKSSLLIDEPPLQVLPTLAVAIGLNEAIFIQQLHWLLSHSGKAVKGQEGKWIYNTAEEWHEKFPFWSVSTIKRIITGLRKEGLIKAGRFNRMTLDQTRWYTIDYEALNKKSPIGSDWHNGLGQVDTMTLGQSDPMLPEIKNTNQRKGKGGETAPPADTTPVPERPAPPPSPLNDQHPFVVVFREVVGGFLNKVQRAELEAMPLDSASVDKWREVLRVWMLNDWNRRNVPGMIDRYRKEGQPAAAPTPQTRVRNGIEEHKHGGVWYPAHSVQGASR